MYIQMSQMKVMKHVQKVQIQNRHIMFAQTATYEAYATDSKGSNTSTYATHTNKSNK